MPEFTASQKVGDGDVDYQGAFAAVRGVRATNPQIPQIPRTTEAWRSARHAWVRRQAVNIVSVPSSLRVADLVAQS